MIARPYIIGLTAAALLCGSCGSALPVASSQSAADMQPTRIVSLDYCADQYVLKMVDADRILAVSKDAGALFSYMRGSADGVPTVRSTAEDVLALRPDLVVRAYGGGPNAASFFERAGIPVLNVGWAGDLEGIKRVTREMATGLGEAEKGEAIVADMEARLAALPKNNGAGTALYMTPSGTTSGTGSLVDVMMTTAGLTNFQDKPGWHSLPLERLAYEQPDMIAAAFFESNANYKDAWSAMRHPVARAQIDTLPVVQLNGAWMSCGAWYAVDAVEALAKRQYAEDGS